MACYCGVKLYLFLNTRYNSVPFFFKYYHCDSEVQVLLLIYISNSIPDLAKANIPYKPTLS